MSRVTKAALSAALISAVISSGPFVFAGDAPADNSPVATSGRVSTRRALDRPLPQVKFNGVPLSDVLDFLSDTTSSNMAVDWRALDEAHVEKDTPITLRMSSQVPLHKVLNLVLQQAGGTGALTYYVDEGVIQITSQEASDKVLITKVYPIQDLLFEAPDYNNSPNLSLQNAGQGQSGGGGAGGGGGGGGASQQGIFTDTNQNQNQSQNTDTQKSRADEIIKLITDTVKPELWQINGGTATISFFRGNLIVNAPRSIHEMLQSQ